MSSPIPELSLTRTALRQDYVESFRGSGIVTLLSVVLGIGLGYWFELELAALFFWCGALLVGLVLQRSALRVPVERTSWFGRNAASQLVMGTVWGCLPLCVPADRPLHVAFAGATLVAVSAGAAVMTVSSPQLGSMFLVPLGAVGVICLSVRGGMDLLPLTLIIAASVVVELFTCFTLHKAKRDAIVLHQRLDLQVQIDDLTRVLRRRAWFDELETSRSLHDDVAIAFLDVDDFKETNDRFGHDAGDQMLREIGQRLARLGDGIVAGRLGGDEFGVFATSLDAEQLGEHLRLLSGFRVTIGSSVVRCRMSIGVVQATTSELTRDAVRRADELMYANKAKKSTRMSSRRGLAA